jgi:hypothetical protein
MTALLVAAFPGVFLRGELISSADILFAVPPWDAAAPDGFDKPKNVLKLDPLVAFRPDYRLVKEQLAAGRWPTWNPLEYTGVPLLANAQSAVFYPPYLLRDWFDVDTAMTLFVLLKLWLCGATAYVCARLIGLGIGASRFLSAAWMIGSYNLIWASWPLPDTSAWAPVLLLGVELLLTGRLRRGFFCMALGATLILFAAHPESAFTLSLGVGLYMGLRLLWERRWGRTLWQPVGIAGAAWCLALAVFMVQFLPFAEYVLHSYTFGERSTAQSDLFSMRPSAAIGFWIARYHGTNAEGTFRDINLVNSNLVSGQYLGMAVWLGLSLGVAGLFRKSMVPLWRARLSGLVLASIPGILLAYQSPVIAIVNQLPIFDSTRPIYHACFAYFALPLASATGFDHWYSKPRKIRELWPSTVTLAVLTFFTAGIFWWDYRYLKLGGYLDYVLFQVQIAAVFAIAALAVLTLSCVWRRPRILWAVLTITLIADHLYACRGLNHTMVREDVFPATDLTQFLNAQEVPCRSDVSVVSGGLGNYGIEEWLGYDGIYPERILRYQNALKTAVWDVMEPIHGVRFYVHDPKRDFLQSLDRISKKGVLKYVATCDGLDIYENVGGMPRAFLTGALEVIPNVDALFERMIDPAYDPAQTAITEVPLTVELPSTPSRDVGEARIIEYRSDRVQVAINARRPAVLVLTDAYYPGWHATLEGEPLGLFPVYYAFRGALVPEGEHTVVYQYDPLSLRVGYWISVLALLASAIASVLILFRGRQARQS